MAPGLIRRFAGFALVGWLVTNAVATARITPALSGGFFVDSLPLNVNDGTEFVGQTSVPLTRADGTVAGSANVLSILKNDTAPYLPTVANFTIDGRPYVLLDVRSRDDLIHWGFAYEDSQNGPVDFYLSNIIVASTANKATLFFDLAHPSLTPIAGPTIDSAFFFLEEPHRFTFPELLLTHRLSQWHEIVRFGEARDAGDNVNVSAAAPNQAFVMNVLRGQRQRPRILTLCVAPGRPCGAMARTPVGLMVGDAVAGNAAGSGLVPVPNSVGRKRFTHAYEGIGISQDHCPPDIPLTAPPVASGFVTNTPEGAKIEISWMDVMCATGYLLELYDDKGGLWLIEAVVTTKWEGLLNEHKGVAGFRVAALKGDDISVFTDQREILVRAR